MNFVVDFLDMDSIVFIKELFEEVFFIGVIFFFGG